MFGTLETLGPKIKIYQNFILRASGDAMEEVILFYATIIPSVQVLRSETPLRRRPHRFSGNPRRVVWFYRRGEMANKGL
jgi:hypothetical protein